MGSLTFYVSHNLMSVRRLQNIPGFSIDRVAAAAGDDPAVLRLENLDTDLALPPGVIAATQAALGRDDDNSYLPFTGQAALRAAVARHVDTQTGHGYRPRPYLQRRHADGHCTGRGAGGAPSASQRSHRRRRAMATPPRHPHPSTRRLADDPGCRRLVPTAGCGSAGPRLIHGLATAPGTRPDRCHTDARLGRGQQRSVRPPGLQQRIRRTPRRVGRAVCASPVLKARACPLTRRQSPIDAN